MTRSPAVTGQANSAPRNLHATFVRDGGSECYGQAERMSEPRAGVSSACALGQYVLLACAALGKADVSAGDRLSRNKLLTFSFSQASNNAEKNGRFK